MSDPSPPTVHPTQFQIPSFLTALCALASFVTLSCSVGYYFGLQDRLRLRLLGRNGGIMVSLGDK